MIKLLLTSGILLSLTGKIVAQPPAKVQVIIDTDIGSDVDDAFALALALASPELDLRAITTVGGQAEDRAWIVCRFLTQVGRKDIPVAFGRDKQPESMVDWQIQYRRHPAAIFNRTNKPAKEPAIDLLYRLVKEQPGKITLIALGPLTNVAQLLEKYPDAGPMIQRIVLMGGALKVGYEGKKAPEPEWNIKSDVTAAKAVFTSGIPLIVVPLDATAHLQLDKDRREKLFAAHTMLTFQVQNLYELWDHETPTLFDPLAVALTFDEKFSKFVEAKLAIDARGMTKVVSGKPNARVAVATEKVVFLDWLVNRLAGFGDKALPKPPGNLSKVIDPGSLPTRVHAFEDFDTDIEKRWWMCGKAETKDVPLGGRRACRAVLTQDFDDRQGDMKTMYRAVIFNPVPGPPMARNTRLAFKYKLHGTDTIRVQLYSLTKGYHRYLSINGLAQDQWTSAAVDMTRMLRPDGGGGALAEDERIDDIQFYIDPRAELLIDDIVLYEAADPAEKRPFPRQILYTGLFDTGKQGKEWPGDFAIVPHEKPKTWKAARSVASKDGSHWIRLDLKGERRVGEVAELFFRFQLTGADSMRVEVAHRPSGRVIGTQLKQIQAGLWSEGRAAFTFRGGEAQNRIDEIRFLLPAGGTLLLDDLLLYIPGQGK